MNRNFIDAEFRALPADRTGPALGLVVRSFTPMTESRFVELYGGDWRALGGECEVEFDPPVAPGRGIEDA